MDRLSMICSRSPWAVDLLCRQLRRLPVSATFDSVFCRMKGCCSPTAEDRIRQEQSRGSKTSKIGRKGSKLFSISAILREKNHFRLVTETDFTPTESSR